MNPPIISCHVWSPQVTVALGSGLSGLRLELSKCDVTRSFEPFGDQLLGDLGGTGFVELPRAFGATGFDRLHASNPTFTFLADIGFGLVMFVAGSHVPVRDASMKTALRIGLLRAVARVENDEIIAEPVHLVEALRHRRPHLGSGRRCVHCWEGRALALPFSSLPLSRE